MDFVIVAIDHLWQSVLCDPFEPAEENRAELAALLTKTIEARKVDLICEESDPAKLSVAEKIAAEHVPPIRWKNINMSEKERQEAGIAEGYRRRPHRFIEGDLPNVGQRIDQRIPEDGVREQFFAAETIREAKASGARTVVILCGDLHADSLGVLLERNGNCVEVDHTLIHEKHWE